MASQEKNALRKSYCQRGTVLLQALINDSEPSVQQALAKNCVDLLAALPGESRISLFQQMSSVIAESGCAWRIRLALADQLGTIALLFDIKVRTLPQIWHPAGLSC